MGKVGTWLDGNNIGNGGGSAAAAAAAAGGQDALEALMKKTAQETARETAAAVMAEWMKNFPGLAAAAIAQQPHQN